MVEDEDLIRLIMKIHNIIRIIKIKIIKTHTKLLIKYLLINNMSELVTCIRVGITPM